MKISRCDQLMWLFAVQTRSKHLEMSMTLAMMALAIQCLFHKHKRALALQKQLLCSLSCLGNVKKVFREVIAHDRTIMDNRVNDRIELISINSTDTPTRMDT